MPRIYPSTSAAPAKYLKHSKGDVSRERNRMEARGVIKSSSVYRGDFYSMRLALGTSAQIIIIVDIIDTILSRRQ